MGRRLVLTLAVPVVGTALLVASGLARPAEGGAAAVGATKGGTLRLSSVFDVDSVDPGLAYSINSWLLQYATCAKLFNYPDAPGAQGTRVIPEVVDRYAISEDGRTYTFDLKRSFRFHTGARVTAQSFADAFNRDAQPQLASPATVYLRDIVGAARVLDGTAQSISGIQVLGPYRLRIRLTKPAGDLTARLTMPFFCPILPRTPVDRNGIDNPGGSGPYYVAERIVNQRLVLRRNPHYRGSRPTNVDEIVLSFGETSDACVTAVEQDRNDNCLILLPSAYRGVADRHGINRPNGQFFVAPGMSTEYVVFNHERPAFKGPGQNPLKKAINYAIDRPAMSRAWGYLAGKRTDQLLPTSIARGAHIYPLGGLTPPPHASGWRVRSSSPRRSSCTRAAVGPRASRWLKCSPTTSSKSGSTST